MEQQLKALWDAVNALPVEERDYAVRYVTRNAHLSFEDMLAKWRKDRTDREEAAKIQKHRDEKVLGEAEAILKRMGVEMALTGVKAGGKTGKAKG